MLDFIFDYFVLLMLKTICHARYFNCLNHEKLKNCAKGSNHLIRTFTFIQIENITNQLNNFFNKISNKAYSF